MRSDPNSRVKFSSFIKFAVVIPLLFLPAWAVSSGKLDQPSKDQAARSQFANEILYSVTTLTKGDWTEAALRSAEAAIEFWWPGIGGKEPDWLSRTEFELDVGEDDKPEFSLLTVQPLFQSANKRDTIFTQLRVARNFSSGEHRITTNAGLGYRRLLANNTILVGANLFYDYEWKFQHSRIGVGGEVRFSAFDFYVNYYNALSGKRGAGTDTSEEALDGLDVELTAQVPYLPWARVRGKYFTWDTKALENNIDGYSSSVEMDLHQNLQVEAGYTDDDFNKGVWFVKLRFIPGNRNRPVLASNRAIDTEAFRMRDMRDHTLDKVRRQNNIIVERTTGGSITVSRGS